jgi:hypothetical protein
MTGRCHAHPAILAGAEGDLLRPRRRREPAHARPGPQDIKGTPFWFLISGF